jgi:hypothetical protein
LPTSKNKKSIIQSKQPALKFIKIYWAVIAFLVVLIILCTAWFWFSQYETQNFSLQPLEASTIYMLPIEPSSDKSHQESLDITGKLNGELYLHSPMNGNFELTFTGLIINEVLITTNNLDEENGVNILYRTPFEVDTVFSAVVETAIIDIGASQAYINLHSSAPNFEFTYEEEARRTKGSINLSLEEGNSTIRIEGYASDSITTDEGTLKGVYIITLYGVKKIKFGDEIIVTPEKVSLVVIPDGNPEDDFDEYCIMEIDSNFTNLRHFPAEYNLIDIRVLAPLIKLANPSGILTHATEILELSKGFSEVTIKAADEYLAANINSEIRDYEAFITGKSNNIVVNGAEIVNTRWQALSSEWRITVLTVSGTIFTSIVLFMAQKYYQFIKKEKIQ